MIYNLLTYNVSNILFARTFIYRWKLNIEDFLAIMTKCWMKINLEGKLVFLNHILTFRQIDDGRFERSYLYLQRGK